MPTTIVSAGLGTLPEPAGAQADELLSGRLHLAAARDLDRLGVTQLVLDDAMDAGDGEGIDGIRQSAVELAAWLAPSTDRLGLIPVLSTSHTEPFLLGTQSATLDFTSRGRSGIQLAPSLRRGEAGAIGRRPAVPAGPAWAETAEVADIIRALWDSWEHDAIIADVATDRFIDRDKLHYIDATARDSTGAEFTVKGPSIVPRPPQGHLPVLVRLEDGTGLRGAAPGTAEELAPAAARSDAVIVPWDVGAEQLDRLRGPREDLRFLAALPSAEPAAALDAVAQQLHDGGFAGIHVDTTASTAAETLEAVLEGLTEAGLEPSGAQTLRGAWSLGPAENRYASA